MYQRHHQMTMRHSSCMCHQCPCRFIIYYSPTTITGAGNKEDKSESFAYTIGENGALLIDDAKVSIECEVDGNYELENFDNFVCKIVATYAKKVF